MAMAEMVVPLALTAASKSDSSGPVNLTGRSYHGVRVVKLCWGRASSIFMSNRALSPAFFSPILPEMVRIGRSLGASRAKDGPVIRRPENKVTRERKWRRVFMGNILQGS